MHVETTVLLNSICSRAVIDRHIQLIHFNSCRMMLVDVDTLTECILFQNKICVYQSSVKTFFRLGQFINSNSVIRAKKMDTGV